MCHHNPSNSPFCGAKYRLLKTAGVGPLLHTWLLQKRWRRISICPLKNKNKIQEETRKGRQKKKGCAIFFSFDVSLYVVSLLPRCWIPGVLLTATVLYGEGVTMGRIFTALRARRVFVTACVMSSFKR